MVEGVNVTLRAAGSGSIGAVVDPTTQPIDPVTGQHIDQSVHVTLNGTGGALTATTAAGDIAIDALDVLSNGSTGNVAVNTINAGSGFAVDLNVASGGLVVADTAPQNGLIAGGSITLNIANGRTTSACPARPASTSVS